MVTSSAAQKERLIPVICRLSSSSSSDMARIELECSRPPWSRELLEGEFKNDCALVYGARFDGQLIGFIICHVVMDEAHVINLSVLQDYRGFGVGRSLIEYVLTELHEHAVRWVTLEVRRSNNVARCLYESLGFLEVGVRERYYSDNEEDGVVLKLNLQQFAHDVAKFK